MMSSSTENDCACSIASARIILEQAGFTIIDTTLYGGSAQTAEERDEMFTLYCSVVAVLVLVAGLMSGLTLGLMSLDTLDLEVCFNERLVLYISSAYLPSSEPLHHLQQLSLLSLLDKLMVLCC